MAETQTNPTSKSNKPKRILDYRAILGRRQWLRERVFTERVVNAMKQFAWVAPLTLLIWIYAEREQQQTEENVSIPFRITTNDPNRIVRLMAPMDSNVVVTLRGPRQSVTRVQSMLVQRSGDPAVQIAVDPRLTPGREHELPAVLIGQHPLFEDRGVQVTNARPQYLMVFVDEVLEREVRIQAPPQLNNLESEPVFDPATVKVRGPRKLLDEAASEGRLSVTANLNQFNEIKTPGQHELTEVPLALSIPEEEGVSLSASHVRATVRVRRADVEWSMGTMAVLLNISGTLVDKYDVKYQETISNVKLIGPEETIRMLQDEKLPPPKAFLEVSSDDLPVGTPRTKRLRFDLPEGVRLSEDDPSIKEMTFTLVDRTAPEP